MQISVLDQKIHQAEQQRKFTLADLKARIAMAEAKFGVSQLRQIPVKTETTTFDKELAGCHAASD